ncbi:MAG: thioredoxin family protein [Chloroflexota bacterium]
MAALQIGQRMPSFSLPGTDGETYSGDSFADKRFLTVLFLANHCPYVSAWEDRIVAIANEFGDRGVGFAAFGSNDVERFPADDLDHMKQRSAEAGYPFPYLFDKDGDAARAFGATRTPEVFVFDQERHLQYHGAVDSDYEESSHMDNYLREALDRLLTGQTVPLRETPVVGCVIKTRAVTAG